MTASTIAIGQLRPVVASLRFVALLALQRAAPGVTDREIRAAMLQLGFEPAKLGLLPFFVKSEGLQRSSSPSGAAPRSAPDRIG